MAPADIQKQCSAIINGLRECVALDGNHSRDHLYRCAAEAIATVLELVTPGSVVALPPLPDRTAPDPQVFAKVIDVAHRLLLPLQNGDGDSYTRSLCYAAAVASVKAAVQLFITPDDASVA